ncbi:MAG TPA: glucosaminidase domain-containing protein [Bacteroidales bacterium]|nr:glucosaminidase domain-containing protein [Bacteroidales bacterium]
MKAKNLLFVSVFFIFQSLPTLANSPQRITLPEYIAYFRDLAISEMRLHRIPASIKLAQAILESGFGNSRLARYGNNHFGIKCHGWTGRYLLHDDDAEDECFRAYDCSKESFRDHSQFLLSRPWYAPLFKLDIMDYRAWAHGLRRAGYATNPRYAELLIRIIEENQLMRYDSIAMNLLAALPERKDLREARSRSANFASTESINYIAPQQLENIRVVKTNNRIRYIIAHPGDTPESVAKEMNMRTWQIVRYNELENGRQITPGQIIYLQPKRRQGVRPFHIVQPGETLYDISQQHGIKMEHLLSRNNLQEWQQPTVGTKILLRGRLDQE